MSSRAIFGLLALFLGLVGATMLLARLNGSGISAEELVLTGAILTLAFVGLLIVSRRSRNSIGWIMIWIAFSAGFLLFSTEYARYALLTQPGSLPFGLIFAWTTSWIWVLYVGLVGIYLPLLFPTGRLLSPKWRGVAWAAGAYLIVVALLSSVRPGPLPAVEPVSNPLGLGIAGKSFELIEIIVNWPLAPLVLASVSALLIRFARSRGDERAQLKWFFFVAALFLLYVLYGTILDLPEGAGTFMFSAFLTLFGIAIGIAILKYRLYDIDLIIRKTLVYAALTLLLALAYFGGVTLLESVISAISDRQSAISIVISTLAIAALFNPLRRRVQEFIDRRFYRRKYDAEQTLETFSASLREQVELEQLSTQLITVVEETMQPKYVSFWICRVPEERQPAFGALGAKKINFDGPS